MNSVVPQFDIEDDVDENGDLDNPWESYHSRRYPWLGYLSEEANVTYDLLKSINKRTSDEVKKANCLLQAEGLVLCDGIRYLVFPIAEVLHDKSNDTYFENFKETLASDLIYSDENDAQRSCFRRLF